MDYARLIGKLANADWHQYSRLYDEAADLSELATGAAQLFWLHRQQHEIEHRSKFELSG